MIQVIIKYGRPIVLAITAAGSSAITWIWGIATTINWGTSTPDKLWGVPESATVAVNTNPPSISGTAVVGQTLTAIPGTWTGIATINGKWQRNGVDIVGATLIDYTLVAADMGTNIAYQETATNTAGSASVTSSSITIIDTIMDSQTDVYNAWSMVRLLRGAYYGSPIIRLRRTNDNVESDFGVGTNGLLDESAVTTFTGANSATLVTVYAQDGSARHFTNATPSEQPTFVNSGVIVKRTGIGSGAVARPAADFNGTQSLTVNSSTALYNFLHDGNNGWVYSIAEFGKVADPNAIYGLVGNSAASGANRGIASFYDDRVAVPANNGFTSNVFPSPIRNSSANNYITAQSYNLISLFFDADNITAANRGGFALNGGSFVQNNVTITAPNTNAASFNFQWGGLGNNAGRMVGYSSEMIIFNADKTSSDTSIRDNINAIYKTY
jgi:hypothetical protein